MIKLALVLAVVVACDSTEEVEKKVATLEQKVVTLEKERKLLEVAQVRMLKDISDLQEKLDKLEKKTPPLPSYARPSRPAPDPAKVYSVPVDGDPFDGPADAYVTIVEAYEYACPYCEKVRHTIDELKKKYGKDLRVVYKQLVVHPQTATAPALAICAAAKQQKFAKLDALLWEEGYKQRKFDANLCWESSAGCPLIDTWARRAGMSVSKMHDDMKGGCNAWLRGNADMLKKLGAMATPTFFINGRYVSGAQPIDNFARVIDEELDKAKARVAQGTPKSQYYAKAVVEEGKPDLDP